MNCRNKLFLGMNNKFIFIVLAVAVLVFGFCLYQMFSEHEMNDELNPNFDINLSLESHVIEGLEELSSDLAKIHRQHHVSSAEQGLMIAYRQVLHLMQLVNGKPPRYKPSNVTKVNNTDVCQEYYAGEVLSFGHPLFYHGFEIKNCSGTPKFHTLLTIVYNFVHYKHSELSHIKKVVESVNSVYPGVRVVVGIRKEDKPEGLFKDVSFIPFPESTADTDIWNSLILQVRTKYVYIGRDVVHFTWFVRLERLVREINNLNVYFVASATRTLISGKWSNGCEQSVLQNYTLVYRQGYDRSMEECMVCDHTQAPFVTKTKLFKLVPLPQSMNSVSGFAVWFLSLKKNVQKGVVCPDSMSFVSDESREKNTKDQWKHAATALQVERLITADNTVLEFSCDEAGTSCPQVRKPGVALSKCCMDQLTSMIKYVMDSCKTVGISCELQGGALLGAVKLTGILPWEVGGEITVDRKYFAAFEQKLKNTIINSGYKWDTSADGSWYTISNADWTITVHGSDSTSTDDSLVEGITPTVVNLNGYYLATSINPAIVVRNRFGREIYQHGPYSVSDIPWKRVFQPSTSFPACYLAHHHSCLDQYRTDGSLTFKKPVD